MKVRVAIVGAGFAGIAAALRLLAAGEQSFVLLERDASVGGTWRDNTYPGVSCDVPSHLYCYSFLPHPGFTQRFAAGEEIRDYLRRAVEDSAIGERLRLSTRVLAASWDDHRWQVRTSRGPLEADYLVLAAGRTTEPRMPPGVERFEGPVMHTARWRDDVDLTGRRVAVVGTGASAVQVLPHVVDRAQAVAVLMRSAPDVLPRGQRAYSEAERRRFAASPQDLAALREEQRAELEAGYRSRVGDAAERALLRRRALAHLADQVADPGWRSRLTPRHEMGCKRVLLSDDFYPAVQRTTLGSSLASVGADHVLDADGARHDAEVLVVATGFWTTQQPYARIVRGRGGRSLADHWSGGMRAFGSTTVAGFPNLVVLDGPNASLSHSSAVLMIESQVRWLVEALAWGRPLDVDPFAEDDFVGEVRDRSRSAPWTSGCSNWYVDPRVGEQTLLWPGTASEYDQRFGTFEELPFERQRWSVVVPLKPFAEAKTRLDVADRARVARSLAWDTVTAALDCSLVGEVVVVTDETDLPAGVRVVAEPRTTGLDAAIRAGLESVPLHHHRAVLLGDLPALDPADLADALRRAARHVRATVPDAEGVGTTLLTARSGVPLSPAFGAGSAARHRRSAAVLPAAPGLRRDVDVLAHLEQAESLRRRRGAVVTRHDAAPS